MIRSHSLPFFFALFKILPNVDSPTRFASSERVRDLEHTEDEEEQKLIRRREMNCSGDHVTIEFDRSEFMNE